MSIILSIETSTDVCSIALSKNSECIYYQEDKNGPSHAVRLGEFVDRALSFASENSLFVDAISVSSGPGSYTGLRIGVSMAKGLCYGFGVPLISVPTLALMTEHIRKDAGKQVWLCPMLDARRMEVYTAVYDAAGNVVTPVHSMVVNADSYDDIPENKQLWFFGNGAEKCKKVFNKENVIFKDGIYPSAKDMILLAEKAYLEKRFEDIAYFEPFYLKEFKTTVSKKWNRVLGINI